MNRLHRLTEQEFEDLCDGCGKCCESDTSGFGCPSLDTVTNRCMNYEGRLTHKYAMCLTKHTPENIMPLHRAGNLPDSCAYVRFYRGLPPLPRPVEPAKLIPFILAGPRHIKRYEKARKKWDELRGNVCSDTTYSDLT